MDVKLREKLTLLAEEVKKNMANPDIELEVCFEGVEEGESCEPMKYPYIKVKYVTEEHDVHEKIIEISSDHFNKSIEELKNYVTFLIEQFMEEIDSVEYGGE